jgi:hypothetical protein
MFARFSRRRLLGGLLASLCGALLPRPPAAAAPTPPAPPAPPPSGWGTASFYGTTGRVSPSGLLYGTYLGGGSTPDRPAGAQEAPPQQG